MNIPYAFIKSRFQVVKTDCNFMNCKKCIKNPIWNKFLPKKLLIICPDCNEFGIQYRKIYIWGAYFAIVMYFVTIILSINFINY